MVCLEAVQGACLLVVSLVSTVSALPPDTSWTRAYGADSEYDDCYSVCQTSDGTYIAVGTKSSRPGLMDAWLLKLDADGDTQWTMTYGSQYADDARAVHQTRDGGYIIARSLGLSDLPLWGPWLVKTDANGATLWSRSYGWGLANGAQQTFDGGYILVGFVEMGDQRALLVKADTNGDTIWTRDFSGLDTEEVGYAVRQTPDSGYAVLANTVISGIGSLWLLRTDAKGDTIWTRRLGAVHANRNSLALTSDGGFAVAAHTDSLGQSAWLARLDGSGNTLWTKVYQGELNNGVSAVQQTVDGGFIIAGIANNVLTDSNDIQLVRTDANGDTLWTKTVGGPGNQEGYSVQQTLDSGYIVGGTTASHGGTRAYFVKIRPDHGEAIGEETPSREKLTPSPGDRWHGSIYDVNGRRICSVSDLGPDIRFQPTVQRTGRLPAGVYFVTSDRDALPRKVVIRN